MYFFDRPHPLTAADWNFRTKRFFAIFCLHFGLKIICQRKSFRAENNAFDAFDSGRLRLPPSESNSRWEVSIKKLFKMKNLKFPPKMFYIVVVEYGGHSWCDDWWSKFVRFVALSKKFFVNELCLLNLKKCLFFMEKFTPVIRA